MRFYILNCLRGAETATYYTFETWAVGIGKAFDHARRAGYNPVSVAHSSWVETRKS